MIAVALVVAVVVVVDVSSGCVVGESSACSCCPSSHYRCSVDQTLVCDDLSLDLPITSHADSGVCVIETIHRAHQRNYESSLAPIDERQLHLPQ